jgi:molybdenum cofactor synthesis domain-containing protein
LSTRSSVGGDVRACVVVVGDEILAGHTRDANGPFLATELRQLGHELVRITVVPDDEDEIVDALRDAERRADLLFACGGLGPTQDDVTIDAVAGFLERPLDRPPEAEEQLRRIYRWGKERDLIESDEVDEGAWRMARVPEGGTVVRNDEGAAPGSVHELDGGGRLVVLPGPPAELQSVFGHVRDRGLVPEGEPGITREVPLATFEAPVSGDLAAFDDAHPDVRVGSYPKQDEKRVVVRLRGPEEAVREARRDLGKRLGELIVDDGAEDP